MDWDKLFKKYVWDDEKTPYFVPVDKLTRTLADYEVRVYTVFLGVLFAAVALIFLSEGAPGGRSYGASFYGFTVVCAALIFAITKHYYAALYCGAVPVAALGFLTLYGFSPKLGTIDHVVIVVFLLLWLRYSYRIVAIGRRYDHLPERLPDDDG